MPVPTLAAPAVAAGCIDVAGWSGVGEHAVERPGNLAQIKRCCQQAPVLAFPA
jgi:hypothetical protein